MLLAASSSTWAVPTINLSSPQTSATAGGSAVGVVLDLTNPDGVAGSNVVATIAIPQKYVSVNNNLSITGSSAGSFHCLTPQNGSTGTFVCRASNFPAGGAVSVSFVLQSPARNSAGTQTFNGRLVSSGAQFTDTLSLPVTVSATLTPTATAPSTARVGSNFVYQLATNSGGFSALINASVSLTLPAGVEFVSVFGTGNWANACRYLPATAAINCNASILEQNSNSAIHLSLKTNSSFVPGTLTLTSNLTVGSGTLTSPTASAAILIAP
ncbi:hypothetical protein C7S18_10050 [Ahniella affigens]|uniref:DUF11 domain-containing protein n=1 Tax=Ahniella affigens TaxID=2021234 RepID=A0A2P1PRN8_9GAMM|nr:hypothetical protein C7S18_10050 [Ahniella affigens]